MAIVLGTNAGFVSVAPSTDPDGSSAVIDYQAHTMLDTSPATATKITEVGWYCSNATQAANFEVGLYDDDGATLPGEAGTRLQVNTTNAKGTGLGWKSCTGLNWSISSSTDYWIAIQCDDTATSTGDDYASSGGSGADMIFSQSSLPDPFGGGGLIFSSGMFALYALWEAGESPYDDGTGINIGDDWKTVDVTAMQINIGDAWKAVEGLQVNIGDDWKTIS